ncbi:MAG: MerR family transcriptional regulator [Mangrovicoccus sp.]
MIVEIAQDVSEELRLTFKDMCAKFDVTPRTLRYYEYIELLAPEKEGRSRLYSPREVARMKLILRGRRFGFSLEEIRQWLLIYDEKGNQAQMEAWINLADTKLQSLIQDMQQLEDSIEELRRLRDTVKLSLDVKQKK